MIILLLMLSLVKKKYYISCEEVNSIIFEGSSVCGYKNMNSNTYNLWVMCVVSHFNYFSQLNLDNEIAIYRTIWARERVYEQVSMYL